MSLFTEADDWQVFGISSFGGGVGLAAAFCVFDFFSETADLTARFRISGFGSGLGGSSLGFGLPGVSTWSSIECDRAFSAKQLDHTAGTIATLTVGVGANVGPCLISAVRFFSDQDVGGISGGLSAGAMVLAGRWRFTRFVHNRPAVSTAVA